MPNDQVTDYDGLVFVLFVFDDDFTTKVFTTLELLNVYVDNNIDDTKVAYVVRQCKLTKELD